MVMYTFVLVKDLIDEELMAILTGWLLNDLATLDAMLLTSNAIYLVGACFVQYVCSMLPALKCRKYCSKLACFMCIPQNGELEILKALRQQLLTPQS